MNPKIKSSTLGKGYSRLKIRDWILSGVELLYRTMKIPGHHPWNVTAKEAVALQKKLRPRINLSKLPREPKTVAGVDVSYASASDTFYSGIVVLDLEDMAIVEEVTAQDEATFPYVPGLLSFREGPVVLKAFEKLKSTPDVVLFDGQGIAHPRGLGIASHMGLILNIPTIGCAKSRLCGEYQEPGREKGLFSYLSLGGSRIGAVVRTKTGVKPVFVSPGHLIDLDGSIEIVLQCCTRYRLPEPTRQAHLFVNRVRRSDL